MAVDYSLYYQEGDFNLNDLFKHAEHKAFWSTENQYMEDAGYREWYIKLIKVESEVESIVKEERLDIQPIQLNHLYDGYTPMTDIPNVGDIPPVYTKVKLYNGLMEILKTWMEKDINGIDTISIRHEDKETPLSKHGNLIFVLRYSDSKTEEENLQDYQTFLTKLNALLSLLSKVKVHLNAPAKSDGFSLRYQQSNLNLVKKHGSIFVPFPLYFYFEDMNGELASMLPDYYHRIDDIPYRVYSAKTDIFGQVILDVLNYIHYQTNNTLLINHSQE